MKKEKNWPKILGYKVNGTPITQQALKDRVKAASKRVKAGEFITQEELEEEVKNW